MYKKRVQRELKIAGPKLQSEFDEFSAIWSNWSKGIKDFTRENNKTFSRTPDSMRDPEFGLGLAFRWYLLALSLFVANIKGKKAPETAEFHRFCAHLSQKKMDLEGQYKDLIQFGYVNNNQATKYKKMGDSAEETYRSRSNLQMLCEEHATLYPDIGLTPARFMAKLTGPHAFERFYLLITKGIPCPESSTELVANVEYYSERVLIDGKDPMDELLAKLSDEHGNRPILPAYLTGGGQGIRAIACALSERLSRDPAERPHLLIPISGLEAPHDRRRDVEYVADTILHWLFGEKLLNYSANANVPDRYTSDEYPLVSDRVIQKLFWARDLIGKTGGVIIIFTGHEPVTGPYRNLVRAIRRTPPLQQVLDILVHPSIAGESPELALHSYRNTDFVVLSSAPMDMLSTYRREDIKFGQPVSSYGPAILKSYIDAANMRMFDNHINAAARGVAKHSFPQNDIVEGFSDRDGGPEEVFLAAVFQKLELCAKSAPSALNVDFSKGVDLIAGMMDEVKSELDLLRLSFIALSESGVKKESLEFWTRSWIVAVAESGGYLTERLKRYCGMPSLERRETDTADSIDEFLVRYRHILALTMDELGGASIKSADHPYVYPSYPTGAATFFEEMQDSPDPILNPTRSIVFMYQAVRNEVLKRIGRKPDQPWNLPLMREIIASDALRQHLIQRRMWEPWQSAGSKSLRRAWECLYHGFLSLPPKPELAASKTWPRAKWPAGFESSPQELFGNLYQTLFREMLDGNTTYRLSRHLAVDAVRLDIARLAQSAFSGTDHEEAVSFDQVPCWHDMEGIAGSQPVEEFMIDHLVVAAMSARRMGMNVGQDGLQIVEQLEKFESPDLKPAILARIRKTIADFEYENKDHLKENSSTALLSCRERLEALSFNTRLIDGLLEQDFVANVANHAAFSLSVECAGQYLLEHASAANASKDVTDWLTRYADLLYAHSQVHLNTREVRGGYALAAFTATLIAKQILISSQKGGKPLPIHLTPLGLRTMIRSGLELIRLIRTHAIKRGQCKIDRLTRLQQEIRGAMDYYALKYSGFAPDQVSMLLLESRFARTVGGTASFSKNNEESPQSDFIKNTVAANYLRRAEVRMYGFGFRPRLRIRFLLEQCAVLRDRCNVQFKDVKSKEGGVLQAIHNLVTQIPQGTAPGKRWTLLKNQLRDTVGAAEMTALISLEGFDVKDNFSREDLPSVPQLMEMSADICTEKIERLVEILHTLDIAIINMKHAMDLVIQAFGTREANETDPARLRSGWHLLVSKQEASCEAAINATKAELNIFKAVDQVLRSAN